jgi:hypothetical protein
MGSGGSAALGFVARLIGRLGAARAGAVSRDRVGSDAAASDLLQVEEEIIERLYGERSGAVEVLDEAPASAHGERDHFRRRAGSLAGRPGPRAMRR